VIDLLISEPIQSSSGIDTELKVLNKCLKKSSQLGEYKLALPLLRAGACSFTTCIQNSSHANHVTAYLQLCQAALENNVEVIKLLTDPLDGNVVNNPEFTKYHAFRYILLPLLSNGKLPFTVPIRVALRAKNMQAVGELLLHAHLTQKVGRVDWQGLELESIDKVWLMTLRRQTQPIELLLSRNKLKHIPANLSAFPQLQVLHMSKNSVVFVPTELFTLPSIKEIDLSKNKIEYLPEAIIGNVTPTLINLNVSHNKLTSFPDYFAESKMEYLTLSHNSFCAVPNSCTKLQTLRHLDISYNVNIHVMPHELGGLAKLRSLRMDGIQQIANVPVNLQGPMLLFLRKRFESLKSFEHFDLITVEAECSEELRLKFASSLQISSSSKFSILSMKSVEQFLMLHSTFRLPSSVYLILWDCMKKQPLDMFASLLHYLTVVCPSNPIVIAAIYSSAIPEDVDLRIKNSVKAAGIDLKDNMSVKPVSLQKTGMFSVAELVTFIIAEAKPIAFRGKVPGSYLALVDVVQLNHLKRQSEKISQMISKAEFMELVNTSTNDINGDKELPDVVNFLQSYAALLHFPTVEGIDIFFISRQWLANYLYRLVTATTNPLLTDNAILPEFAIKDLVEDQDLVSSVFEIFVRFLFKSGFVLPISDKKLLLPPALEPRPNFNITLPEKDRVRRWIKLPVIPPMFWARFICHQLISLQKICLSLSKVDFARLSPNVHWYEEMLDWKYWDSGFTCWENAHYLVFCVEEIINDHIQIMVPHTTKGLRLLQIVSFQINSLLKGWYPEIWESVEHFVPCNLCVAKGNPEPCLFSLIRCMEFASKGGTLKCPHHEGAPITIQSIAPELIPMHIEDDWLISPQSLQFNLFDKSTVLSPMPSETVFKGWYNDKEVAVKPYPHPVLKRYISMEGTTDPPLLALLTETSVLQHLHHDKMPFLMDFLGVSMDPICLVFPLAQHGSLEDVIKSKKLVMIRNVKLRVIHQVAQALVHLHSHRIIHRDVCLGNILVFSLSSTEVSVKLGGFSHALYSMFLGHQQGLVGTYPAPEMSGYGCMLPYDERVDIFAFAFVMYEILVGKILGAEYGSIFTSSVARNVRPHLQHVLNEAAYMGAIINRGWDTHPSRRPYALEIVRHMKQPHLWYVANWQLADDTNDFLCATRRFARRKVTDIFICKSRWDDASTNIISHYSIPDLKLKKSIIIQSPFVPAMCCVKNMLWVSFWHKAVVVYSVSGLKKVTEITLDTVVSSLSCSGKYVYIGYEDGALECYTFGPTGKPLESIQKVNISDNQVTHLEVCIDCVVCSTQNQVLLVNHYPLEIIVKWEASSYYKAQVFHTVIATTSSGTYVWVSFRKCSELVVLDPVMGQLLFAVDCAEALPKEDNIKVLNLISFHDTVWAGLNTGHIMIFKASSPKLLTWLKVHKCDARFLMPLSPSGVSPALVSSTPNSVVAVPKERIPLSTFVLSCGVGLGCVSLQPTSDIPNNTEGLYLVILEALEANIMANIEELSEREQLPMMRTVSISTNRLPPYENAKLFHSATFSANRDKHSKFPIARAATLHGIPTEVKRLTLLTDISEGDNESLESRKLSLSDPDISKSQATDTSNITHRISFFASTSSESSSEDHNAEMSFKEKPRFSRQFDVLSQHGEWSVFNYSDAYQELVGQKSKQPEEAAVDYERPWIVENKKSVEDSCYGSDFESYIQMHTAPPKPKK